MSTVEQRVSFREAKMEDLSRAIADVRDLVIRLEEKMERRFDQIDRRFMWMIGVQFTTLFTIIAVLLRVAD